MRFGFRVLLIFVVAIAIGLCEAALIIGMVSSASDLKSPLFLSVLLSLSMIIGGASGWLFGALEKWARSKPPAESSP